SAHCLLLDLGTARIAEAEELRRLVERFADCVVDRGSDLDVFAHPADGDDLSVASGGKKQTIGKRRIVGQSGGQRMRLEMINRNQRRLGYERDRLCGREPDDDSADETRS